MLDPSSPEGFQRLMELRYLQVLLTFPLISCFCSLKWKYSYPGAHFPTLAKYTYILTCSKTGVLLTPTATSTKLQLRLIVDQIYSITCTGGYKSTARLLCRRCRLDETHFKYCGHK